MSVRLSSQGALDRITELEEALTNQRRRLGAEADELRAELERVRAVAKPYIEAHAGLLEAMRLIERRAFSDAPAEELEDVQRDLRHIHAYAAAVIAAATVQGDGA